MLSIFENYACQFFQKQPILHYTLNFHFSFFLKISKKWRKKKWGEQR